MANHGETIASQSHFLLKRAGKRGKMGRANKRFHWSGKIQTAAKKPVQLICFRVILICLAALHSDQFESPRVEMHF